MKGIKKVGKKKVIAFLSFFLVCSMIVTFAGYQAYSAKINETQKLAQKIDNYIKTIDLKQYNDMDKKQYDELIAQQKKQVDAVDVKALSTLIGRFKQLDDQVKKYNEYLQEVNKIEAHYKENDAEKKAHESAKKETIELINKRESFSKISEAIKKIDIEREKVYNKFNDQYKKETEALKISNAEKSGEHITDFYNENKEWIEDVSNRLEIYLSRFPNDQRSFKLNEILNNSPMQRAYSGNFNWTKYHMRGGRWTFSMNPKWATRLFAPATIDGWNELVRIYSRSGIQTQSINDQYWCHAHFDVTFSDWDLEKGRPNVGMLETIRQKCNPV